MSLSITLPCGWLLNKKAARVEVNISLAFLHWVRITFHPWPFVSDIAVFVLKRDVKLQLTLCWRQTARWIKMPVGMELSQVGLGPGHFLLHGDPAPKVAQPPIFDPCLLLANG